MIFKIFNFLGSVTSWVLSITVIMFLIGKMDWYKENVVEPTKESSIQVYNATLGNAFGEIAIENKNYFGRFSSKLKGFTHDVFSGRGGQLIEWTVKGIAVLLGVSAVGLTFKIFKKKFF